MPLMSTQRRESIARRREKMHKTNNKVETIQKGRVYFFSRSPVLLTVLKQYNNIQIRLHPANTILCEKRTRARTHISHPEICHIIQPIHFHRAAGRANVKVTTTKVLNHQKIQVSRRFVLTETKYCRNKSYKRFEDFQTPFGVKLAIVEVCSRRAHTAEERRMYYFCLSPFRHLESNRFRVYFKFVGCLLE